MKLNTFFLIVCSLALASLVQAAEPLRVMSFNIRYGTAKDGENEWSNRRELVCSTIRNFDPHVLGVQEALAFQIDEIAAAIEGYQVVGVGRDDGRREGEFSALLIKTDRCNVEDSGTFWLSDTPEVPGSITWGNANIRVCTWASLRDNSNHETFHVYNTHWDHVSQPSREKSAKLIVERIAAGQPAKTPVVVMGDFNAGEENPAFRVLIDSPLKLRDCFRLRHPAARDVGTFNGFRGETSGKKIDAILVSPEWTVVAAEIDRSSDGKRYPSDHFPVTATIELRDHPRK
ncbi:MAG: endonuclease/exonuclease/phosphatase family protein [Pirellulales bacterium]